MNFFDDLYFDFPGDAIGTFTAGSVSPSCRPNLRTQTEFVGMKGSLPITGRASLSLIHDER